MAGSARDLVFGELLPWKDVPLQNEDLLFSTAGVRCVIGKVRSVRFDRCTVELLETTKIADT